MPLTKHWKKVAAGLLAATAIALTIRGGTDGKELLWVDFQVEEGHDLDSHVDDIGGTMKQDLANLIEAIILDEYEKIEDKTQKGQSPFNEYDWETPDTKEFRNIGKIDIGTQFVVLGPLINSFMATGLKISEEAAELIKTAPFDHDALYLRIQTECCAMIEQRYITDVLDNAADSIRASLPADAAPP